jgi:peptide chain release factor 2
MTEPKSFSERVNLLKAKLDLAGKQKRLGELEAESTDPNLWQNQEKAQKVMREMTAINQELEQIAQVEKEQDEKKLAELELKVYLGDQYDESDAILSLHAGQGGTEAMDWAQILERMYIKYAENRGWKVEVVDSQAGDEAGIKSATMTIAGSYAYGYLKGEAGVHRLVRLSPFNADRLRQTSFALVEVLPLLREEETVAIREDELEWEFFRSSSHGGQNVQKVATAVRLKHKPSGIVVTAQAQRYQEQNRKVALQLLRAKLWVLADARTKEKEKQLKGEYKIAGWGNQIRSYVLQPYKQIKDLRTGVISHTPEEVLAGDLDNFIEAEIKMI